LKRKSNLELRKRINERNSKKINSVFEQRVSIMQQGLDSRTFNVMAADIFQRLGSGVLELHELVERLL